MSVDLNNTVDNILLSVSMLHDDSNYSEYKYNGVNYPVIEDRNIKFVILPSNANLYKALPKDENIEGFLEKQKCPFPSFYTSSNIAKEYLNFYYPKKGIVKKFNTTRPLKLFILNDVNNLIELAMLFNETSGVKGFLKKSRKAAIKELLMVTGLGVHCLVQEKFQKTVEKKIGAVYEDYKLNKKICEEIKDEKIKRLSLYAIDLQFVKNFCIVLSHYGCDGYIANGIPTAFGEIAPIFHEEIMICLTKNILK